MKANPYSTDLTDEQWIILLPLVPPRAPYGRPPKTDIREVINAIVYLNRAGCAWRMLPHGFPPWKTVYNYFAAWRGDGTWERMLIALRERIRVADEREPTPSACAVDSQSVKTTEQGGARGYDGGKKVKGRKRHLAVDTMGLLLAVAVTAALIDDAKGAEAVFEQLHPEWFPRLEKVWGDNKYHNYNLYDWVDGFSNGVWELEIKTRPDDAVGFVVIRKR